MRLGVGGWNLFVAPTSIIINWCVRYNYSSQCNLVVLLQVLVIFFFVQIKFGIS